MSVAPFLTNKNKRQRRKKYEESEEEELVAPTIEIPSELLPQECAAIRGLVNLFDPDITGTFSEEKGNAVIKYLKAYITQYNTFELRNLIPEQAGEPEDDETLEEEALRTGENLCETSDESDQDKPEDYTKEDLDFVADDDEVEYEEGYEPKPEKKRGRKARKIVAASAPNFVEDAE